MDPRKPNTDDSLLARPLGQLTHWLTRAPNAVTLAAVGAALVAILFTVQFLGFHTKRLDLLNPNSSFNKLWLEYIAEFGDHDDVVIVVESPNRERIAPVKEKLAEAIAQRGDVFHAVLHEVDLSGIRAKALHYAPPEKLAEIESMVDRATPRMAGDWRELSLTHQAGLLANAAAIGAKPPLEETGRLADDLETALGIREPKQHDEFSFDMLSELSPAGINTDEAEFLHVGDAWLGFVLLRINDVVESSSNGEPIQQLRNLIGEIDQEHQHVTIGVTGLPVLEHDEMLASQRDTIKASVVSFVGVAALFVIGFGSWRHPLLTVFTLAVAMAWSFAYVTASVGHLNILSVSFGVILIGLGIDFGIHYVAHYQAERHGQRRSDLALIATSRTVGPGIITGGITTAIAFFTAGLTEFTGVAELGVIAGGGILLCIVAALVLLPAVLFWSDRGRDALPAVDPLHVADWLAPMERRPRLTLWATLLVTAVVSAGALNVRYDHNLLNLQPTNLESVALERKLLNQSDRSVWYAISVADSPAELRRRSDAFLALESVDRVEGIYSLLPPNNTVRNGRISHLAERLNHLPERPPELPIASPSDLGRDLAAIQQQLTGNDWLSISLRRRVGRLRERLRQIPTGEYHARLATYQQRMAGQLLSGLHDLRAVANPAPPTLADLPQALVTRYVGRNGSHLLKIYAKENIWDMDALETFVTEVKSVDRQATGNPLQTFYASRQMQQSYIHAAIYALLAIAIVLMLDFRSIRYSLLAMAPVLMGMAQLFGLMGLLDIPLNPANMIVLPLILGIGIDDGVHVVHDFRRRQGKYKLSNSTAAAILLTSLTTMVGFGSMMIAGHQGLRSLGRVLTIGVACCLFTSLVILPAFLKWWTSLNATVNEVPMTPEQPSVTRRAA